MPCVFYALTHVLRYAGLSFMTFETLKSRIRQRQSANPPSEGDVGVDAEQVGRLPHVRFVQLSSAFSIPTPSSMQ